MTAWSNTRIADALMEATHTLPNRQWVYYNKRFAVATAQCGETDMITAEDVAIQI